MHFFLVAVVTLVAVQTGAQAFLRSQTAEAEKPKGCRKPYPGIKKDRSHAPLPHTYVQTHELPQEFDWRDVNGVNYCSKDLNQHIPTYCGSCWLHAGITVLNDRLKIARRAKFPEVQLARQVILNCGQKIAGSCQGGSDYGVFVFAYTQGIPDDTCQLYSAMDYECSPLRNCMNCDPPSEGGQCYPVQRYGRYFVSEYGSMDHPTVQQMKAEIFKRGPISCAVDASYIEAGKYRPGDIVDARNKTFDLDHDIVIAGWGLAPNGVDEYWIVRNSWGTFWGDHGWFKVKVGVNSMGIETSCAWAVVDPNPVVRDYGPPDWNRTFPSGFAPLDLTVPEDDDNKQYLYRSV